MPADDGQHQQNANDDPIVALRNAFEEPIGVDTIAAMPFAKTALTRAQAEQAGKMLWDNLTSHIRRDRAEEMQTKKILIGDSVMPFDYSVFGSKPASGRSLYISMHGGGGTAAHVNDSQWENQKRLYQIKEGVYVAPRAPTDTWNLWHQGHIDALFNRLIEDMIVFEDVDPDKVYIMGYSAGGDGVYQLAPRMADRWAAAAMMAGHPNETSPLGLRNIGFTIHVGENDNGYDRNKIAKQWKQKLDALQKKDPNGYPHLVQIHEGKGHWMDRQDAVALDWMAKFTRDVRPTKIVWKQDDVRHRRFYWLAIDDSESKDRSLVIATHHGQQFDIETQDLQKLFIRMDDSMVDFDKPIIVTSADKTLFDGKANRTIETLIKTLSERADPQAMFSAEIEIVL